MRYRLRSLEFQQIGDLFGLVCADVVKDTEKEDILHRLPL